MAIGRGIQGKCRVAVVDFKPCLLHQRSMISCIAQITAVPESSLNLSQNV